MANMNGTDDAVDYESGERVRAPMPNYSKPWKASQLEDHRLEAETMRWMLDRQAEEILRMGAVNARDFERIEELERKIAAMEAGERMRVDAEEAMLTEATETIPAKEGEAA